VFWQVGTSATLGARTVLLGNLLTAGSISLDAGASVSGRLLAQAGAVTLNTNSVSLCCDPLNVDPPTLPAGTAGAQYSQTITASGGMAPYTFSVTSGGLPPPLTLNMTTGEIMGTPGSAGVFNFTITATDAKGCMGSQDYTIVVAAGGPMLSLWGMVMLSALLVGAGLVMIRREGLS
jgi:Putative Ig domain/Ice-binding-like